MQYVIKSIEELHVMGISIQTMNSRNEIGPLWQRFREETMREIPGALSAEPYGVYTDYEGDYTAPFTLTAGLPVLAQAVVPPGMMKQRIPAGKYAVFSATGPLPHSVIATWSAIWKTGLERSYQADFEVYHSPENIDIYVGIA